jgi:hypothetical protein
MAVAQLYTAVSGDTITAARWNNEFGNIYNNGTAIAFPLTANVSVAGYILTMDAAGVSTLTSTANIGLEVTPGAKSGSPVVSSGRGFDVLAFTHTDTATAASGTATQNAAYAFQRPTFAATNTSVTLTDGAAVYVANSPANGTNCTITNPWAIWVDDGNCRFDGNLRLTSGYVDGGVNDFDLQNLSFSAAVSGNALTFTLLGGNGSALSTTNAAVIPFRNATVTTAAYTYERVTSALTVVLSAGSTIGYTANNQVGRIYLVAIQASAGSVVLGMWNPLSGTGLTTAAYNLLGLNESIVYTSTAEGGLGAADTAQTLYSTAAQTSRPIRIIGYVDVATGATNGNWTAAPSVLQIMARGIPRTGDIVQRAMSWTGSVATGTTAIPDDTTNPLDNEGDQYMSQALTQQMISSLVKVYGVGNWAHSAVSNICVTVSDLASGATNTDAAMRVDQANVGVVTAIPFGFVYQLQSLSAQTYRIRAGGSTGATTTFNGSAGGVKLGNLFSHVIVEEIAL